MDLVSVERNGLWREAPNKVRTCALWPVAFHRREAGGDARYVCQTRRQPPVTRHGTRRVHPDFVGVTPVTAKVVENQGIGM
jgi:hypothetical protein